jgi:ribosomal protein L25 (general stress protein Ctc)
MTSTIVEYLQGIQTAKEATVQCKNRSGNPAIVYGHFTRADDIHMKHNMYSNTLQRQYY